MSPEKSKVTIGLPIYNGEKFLHDRLENILSQTFSNFDLIISDNASSDRTSEICNEFIKKDKRIKYFKQDVNIGITRNFIFVLNKAETEYFVFAAVDDKWDKTFLEKNIYILEENDSIVGSIGKLERYGKIDEFKPESGDSLFTQLWKWFRSYYRNYGPFQIIAKTYKERASIYLKKLQVRDSSILIYSVFRTKALQKSIMPPPDQLFWQGSCLNVLEYGDIRLVDEVLLYYYTGGTGVGATPLTRYKKKEISLSEYIFPWSTLIYWCKNKFGLKFILRNFFDFMALFLHGEIIFIHSTYQYYLNKKDR